MSSIDRANLQVIKESCQKISRFVEELTDTDAFYAAEMIFDAVLINFVIIGESVNRLTEQCKESNQQIPWAKIRGFRNIVAHTFRH